jgi:DNA uptake protein ComE-like DNA-binding protein
VHANLADDAVLARLVGGSVARAVIERRRDHMFDATLQLLNVRGFPAGDTAVFTVDGSGVVNANAASVRALAALPGLTPEAVERIVWRRGIGRPFTTLDELAGQLSPAARAQVIAHYPDLVRSLTFAAQQVVVTSEGWVGADEPGAGSGALRSTIELLVVPLPERLAVIRRRMW